MNLTRREALSTLAATAALPGAAYNPTLTVQIYVFTQQFAARKQTLAEGMAEAFPAIRRAGYHRVELVDSFFSPELREKTISLLQQHGLECPVAYSGAVVHEAARAEKEIARVLELASVAKTAGARAINVNPGVKPNQELKTDAELALQAQSLNRLGAALRQRGMRLMTHHHTPELKAHGREWRYQLKHTDPKLVYTCVDTDWALRSGEDPIGMLRESGPRLLSLHLRTGHNGVWAEALEDGDPDYHAIANYLKQSGFSGYLVVELAYEKATRVTRPLEENIRLSREYAERVFGVKA
jgi:inosose dehydratase